MFSSSGNSKMTCGLKIDTTVDDWHTSITKILKKIKGASYTINAEEGMAYISGRGDPTSFLRKLKAGKYADICWVRAGNEITYAAAADPYNYEAMQPYSLHGHQLQPGYWSSSHYDARLHYHPLQRPAMAGAYPYHDHYHHHRPYGYWA